MVGNTFEEGQRLSVIGRILLQLQENSLQPGVKKKDEVSKHLLRKDVHLGTQKPLPLMLSSHQACPLSEFQFREQYFLSPLPISFFQTKLTQTLNLLASMLWASLSHSGLLFPSEDLPLLSRCSQTAIAGPVWLLNLLRKSCLLSPSAPGSC